MTRHEHVRKVLSDQRFSREAITLPGAPRLLPIARDSKSIFVMDPPEHTRLRRLVSKAFAPRRIDALRPRLERLATELLDAMESAGPPADLMTHLAGPLPITVICELLGVPYEDVAQFRAWTDIMLSFDAGRREEVLAARDSLTDYLTGLISEKRSRPTQDLLMDLIEASEQGDRLSEEELLAFGYTLLGAGYHATTAEIAHAVIHLTRTPDLFGRLGKDHALLTGAATEMLRYSQAGGGLGALRIAMEDTEIGGVAIKSGEAVLPMVNAANRDPAVFADPGTINAHRDPNPHLAFGHGIHHCLGAQLGRIELEVALGALSRRFPGLRVATAEADLVWSSGVAFRRPAELPLTW
ncbi:cytochrome P450 [Nonomuraea sp. NPDC059007]|uniref:cytochrome P450 n=1 Tax=Nonomuraea sp. NPDC059007 TaxID=3346692 RepID=UPI0036CCC957